MNLSATSSAIAIQRSAERAAFDFGWLNTHHSFSFGGYDDPNNRNWGALRVLNDDVVAPGTGFGTHPHRDMEILTYVLSGELEHKDSMGNVGIVRPGGVQYLSAGTGIAHSEYNHSQTDPVHFVQMWVLPKARGLEPRYGQIDFAPDARRDAWTAYVARVESATLSKTIAAGRLAFLFVGAGRVTLGAETLEAGDAARITGPVDLEVGGSGEVVLWDVPPVAG